jgi:hypothetical protein
MRSAEFSKMVRTKALGNKEAWKTFENKSSDNGGAD